MSDRFYDKVVFLHKVNAIQKIPLTNNITKTIQRQEFLEEEIPQIRDDILVRLQSVIGENDGEIFEYIYYPPERALRKLLTIEDITNILQEELEGFKIKQLTDRVVGVFFKITLPRE